MADTIYFRAASLFCLCFLGVSIIAITLLSHVAVTVLWSNYQTIITRLVTGDSNFSNLYLYVGVEFKS